jgi:hypothetical protein
MPAHGVTRPGKAVAFGLAKPPARAYNVPVRSFIKRRQGMIKLEFNEKAYQEYVKKQEYPSNARVRPEDMSFIDAVIEGQKIMESTEEGRKILEHISRLGE